MAEVYAASVQGQLASGPRQRPYRLRSAADAVKVHKTGKRSAQVGGFDRCATAVIPPHQRDRLEKVCRYILRPPIPESHLEYDGKLGILKLPRPRSDGTTRIACEPAQFVERLSALIPKPRVNQILYHGVLAPGARLRAEVVRFGRPPPLPCRQTDEQDQPGRGRPSASWAEVMKRGLGLDVLTCPKCAGRVEYLATVRDRAEVRKILEHLCQWDDPDADRPPARAPPKDPSPPIRAPWRPDSHGVRHAWLVDPAARTLEVFRLRQGGWLLATAFAGTAAIRAEPFDAIELDLGALWPPAE